MSRRLRRLKNRRMSILTASPAAQAPPRPKGLSRARRHRIWREMHEQLGCTYAEIAALSGYSLRAVKAGVSEARQPTVADVLVSTREAGSLFSDDDLREFNRTPEGRAWLAQQAARR